MPDTRWDHAPGPIVEVYAIRRAINQLAERMFRLEFCLKKRPDAVPGDLGPESGRR
jgi:hypothetical protein